MKRTSAIDDVRKMERWKQKVMGACLPEDAMSKEQLILEFQHFLQENAALRARIAALEGGEKSVFCQEYDRLLSEKSLLIAKIVEIEAENADMKRAAVDIRGYDECTINALLENIESFLSVIKDMSDSMELYGVPLSVRQEILKKHGVTL